MPAPRSFDSYGPEFEDLVLGLGTGTQAKTTDPIPLEFPERSKAIAFRARLNAFLRCVEDSRAIGSPDRDESLKRLKAAVHHFRRNWTNRLIPRTGHNLEPATLVFLPRLSADAPGSMASKAVYEALGKLNTLQTPEPAPPSPEDPHVYRPELYPQEVKARAAKPETKPEPGHEAKPEPYTSPFSNPYFKEDS